MTSRSFLPEAQRRLFYGIWTIVALALALWAVPGPEQWSHDRLGAPKVVLGPELASIFTGARVVEAPAGSFLLEIDLEPSYRDTLPVQGRDFSLGYQFRKSGSVLHHGHLPFRVSAKPRVQLRLPNTDRNHPTDILLSLLP